MAAVAAHLFQHEQQKGRLQQVRHQVQQKEQERDQGYAQRCRASLRQPLLPA